jgi:hypothetical protein
MNQIYRATSLERIYRPDCRHSTRPLPDANRHRLIRDLTLLLQAANQYAQKLDASTITHCTEPVAGHYSRAIRDLLSALERDEM